MNEYEVVLANGESETITAHNHYYAHEKALKIAKERYTEVSTVKKN